MVLLIKQCEHVYMHVIFIITFLFVCLFVFWSFYCKKNLLKITENKNKNLLKKNIKYAMIHQFASADQRKRILLEISKKIQRLIILMSRVSTFQFGQ